MPTYGLLLFFRVDHTASYFMKPELKQMLIVMTFVFTFAMPLFISLILLRIKYVRSFNMQTRKERKLPLLFTASLYAAEYWLLRDRNLPETLKLLMLSAACSVLITVIINLFWKISAHMIGIGALTGAMFMLASASRFQQGMELMAALFLAAALTGMARLRLEAHTPAEIYAGYVIGFFCPFIFMIA